MSKNVVLKGGKPRAVSTGWSDAVYICKKCSKKLKGGFGEDGEYSFKQATRRALREAGRRGAVGLLDAACFGICPKRAVTIAVASRPSELLVMPESTSIDGFVASLSPMKSGDSSAAENTGKPPPASSLG